jgi:hypothetical protein
MELVDVSRKPGHEGSEMEHRLGISHCLLGGGAIVEGPDHFAVSGVSKARGLQVEANDRSALLEEAPHDLGANAAGTAGNNDSPSGHATARCVSASKR